MSLSERRAFIVIDLGYGDAGKGTIVDYLTRSDQAHTIIRFNGGAQAAHNVVTPNGRQHTFSQFGSGIFIPGVQSYLANTMLVEPYAMFNEEEHLHELGVRDAFQRTLLDRRALIITPYQQAANRLRELARGSHRHGSCGMGIGETMADSLTYADALVLAGDLPQRTITLRKLRFLREAKHSELAPIIAAVRHLPAAQPHIAVFEDSSLLEIAADNYAYLSQQLTLVDEDRLAAILHKSGTVIFEGAQGVLLDEWYGFAPYTTWSTTTAANADALLAAANYKGQVTRLGVLRTYCTRHGAGPLVTEDAALTGALPELHNTTSEWQQAFRRGYFDVLAARYALEVAGDVDALAITHLDRLANLPIQQLCHAYHYSGDPQALSPFFKHQGSTIKAIKVYRPPDLEIQAQLTKQLWDCTPLYQMVDFQAEANPTAAYLAAIEQALGVPIGLTSSGPAAQHKVRIPKTVF